MNDSPYFGLTDDEEKADQTKELIKAHPLQPKIIKETVFWCWDILWKTKIGDNSTNFKLKDLNPPAIIVGYFLEKLLGYKLQHEYPRYWRGGINKEDKDLVYIPDDKFSIEVKTSGQLGTKIFGNRSYGQELQDQSQQKKTKSGYYITINFYKDKITLVRFGWIDHNDWSSQNSESGQMAGLKNDVYEYKLFTIYGQYLCDLPVIFLKGIGQKTADNLASKNINYINDLINCSQQDIALQNWIKKLDTFKNLLKLQDQNQDFNFQEVADLFKSVRWFV